MSNNDYDELEDDELMGSGDDLLDEDDEDSDDALTDETDW